MAGNYPALSVLASALEALPRDVVRTQADGPRITVSYGPTTVTLNPVWAGAGYPRDVKRVRNTLVHARETGGVPVVVATRLSPGSLDLLRQERLSWADGEGRLLIDAPPTILLVRDVGEPHASIRSQAPTELGGLPMRWSPGSALVAEHLLVLAAREPRAGHAETELPPGGMLARTLSVAPSLVSRALSRFDQQGWTRKHGHARGVGAGRTLVDPGGLLESWADWHSRRPVRAILAHGLIGDPADWLRSSVLSAWTPGSWAVTGWLALGLRAPWMTSEPTTTLYVDEARAMRLRLDPEALAHVGLREVSSGARVRFLTAGRRVLDDGTSSADLPLVSDVRLYGDLLRDGVRGADAAEHLRSERLGF